MTGLRKTGKCLFCDKQINYGEPSEPHRDHGDQWLDKLFRKWRQPANITNWGGRIRWNGYKFVNLKPYVCFTCLQQAKQVICINHNQHEDWKDARRSPEERAAKKRRMLRKMAYEDYIQTGYWKKVRALVLDKAQHKCEYCGDGSRTLHVHHTTYINRGRELEHLEDLIALCELCHNRTHRSKKPF